MADSEPDNPFSAPSEGPVRGSLSFLDVTKIAISILLMFCITLFIPLGLIGKLVFLFGTSFAIYNFATKMWSQNNVTECPN